MEAVAARGEPGRGSVPRRRRRLDAVDGRWVAGLLALALILRLAWVLAVDREGLPFNDTLFYHEAASALAGGDGYSWLGEPTSRWPPVFPALLAVVYRVFGADPQAGELLNATVGAAAVPLVYLCGLRLLGRREAVVAAAGMAVLPGQVFMADVLLAETLYTTLLVGVLALCLWLPRERWWAAVAVGLAIGVAAETRGEGLVLLVLPLAAWWRPPLRQVALVLAGVAIVVGAWTARNAIEMDAFVPVSTNGSQTLWAGHNPDAHGGPTYPESGADPGEPGYSPRRHELEDSRRLRREAIEWMLDNPWRELSLVPRKLAWLIRGDSEILWEWSQPAGRGAPPAVSDDVATMVGAVADLLFYALLGLTLLAGVAARRSRPLPPERRALWLLLGAALVLYGFVLYGNFRYRLPLEPVMLLLAAPLLTSTILPRTWTSAPSPSA
ncbi:MAG: glycosyltransferase family 39 protein [Thermoleophilaceae bacterium]